MEKTTCPFCNAEIEAGLETCSACGESLKTDSSIDNSVAIDAMLRSAAKLMQDDVEYSFDDESETQNGEIASDTAMVESELSSEQKKKLDEGMVVDLSSVKSVTPEEEKNIFDAISELGDEPEEQEILDTSEEAEEAEEIPIEPAINAPLKSEPQQVTEILPVPISVDISPSDEVKQSKSRKPFKITIKRKEKASKGKRIPAFFVAFAIVLLFCLGIAAGFLSHMIFFSDYVPTTEESFAQKCTSAIYKNFDDETVFVVAKVFINNGVNENTCLIYGGVDGESSEISFNWYRVKYDKENDEYNVFLPLDEKYYTSLLASEDKQDNVLAAVLKNYDDLTKACENEILSGDFDWIKIDMSVVNSYLIKENEKKAEQTTIVSATETSLTSATDITDLTE